MTFRPQISNLQGMVQIVSGSRDKTIKLWNTLGECKFTIAEGEGHTEWVSCVRFSPVTNKPIIVSAGWDRLVKVWNLTNCKLKGDLRGHRYYINTVTVSPDGSLCASGGKVGPLTQCSSSIFVPLPNRRQAGVSLLPKKIMQHNQCHASLVFIGRSHLWSLVLEACH